MATHYKWKTDTQDDKVHVKNILNGEYTLCGIAFEGDAGDINQDLVVTTDKVDCFECCRLIKYCQSIKRGEML